MSRFAVMGLTSCFGLIAVVAPMYDLRQLVDDSSKLVLPALDSVGGESVFSHTRFMKEYCFCPRVESVDAGTADLMQLATEAYIAVDALPNSEPCAAAANALGVWMVQTELEEGIQNGLWLLKRLADAGGLEGMLNWSTCVLKTYGGAGPAEEAVVTLRTLLDHPQATQPLLSRVWTVYGDALLVGHGCKRDGQLALSFFLKAIESNHLDAFMRAAFCYCCPSVANADVVDVNAGVAVLERGAALGAPGCHAYLGTLHILGMMQGSNWERGMSILRLARLDNSELAGDVLDLIEDAPSLTDLPVATVNLIRELAGWP